MRNKARVIRNLENNPNLRVSPYRTQPLYGRNAHTIHDDRSPIKPKNILLILAGSRPHLKVIARFSKDF